MADATPGSVYGDECKLYYSATLGGAGSLTEVPVVIDDEQASERRGAESNCRGDTEIKEHVGKPKHSLSGTMLLKRTTPGTAYAALKTAYFANTVLAYAVATGDVTINDQHVFRFEGRIKKWSETHPDNDTVKCSFEIMPDPESSYASNHAVTTGL